MISKINLYKEFFVEKEKEIFSSGSLKATLFKYANGIEKSEYFAF